MPPLPVLFKPSLHVPRKCFLSLQFVAQGLDTVIVFPEKTICRQGELGANVVQQLVSVFCEEAFGLGDIQFRQRTMGQNVPMVGQRVQKLAVVLDPNREQQRPLQGKPERDHIVVRLA